MPNMTLQDFYTQVQTNGLLVQHQFYINLDKLIGVADYNLFAQGAELPGRTVSEENVNLYGMTFKVPTGMGYTNTMALTLYIDNPRANFLRDKLEAMMELYGQLSKNTGSANKGKIPSTQVELDLLDPTSMDPNTPKKNYILVGCYPTNVGNITLSHTGGGLATIPVNFSYQYYYEKTKNDALSNSQR